MPFILCPASAALVRRRVMGFKKLFIPAIFIIILSCSTANRSATGPDEDQLYVTRTYIGDFEDFRHTAPSRPGDPHLIWIKTTQDSTYGKISAYSRECGFREGDRLYLRRKYVSPGVFGYWMYQIENDSTLSYRVCEYQNDRKILVQEWY
jgi:hypothetical protein